MSNKFLSQNDPKIAKILKKEQQRQQEVLEMIPSENFVSKAVLEALGSVATNKYAEGYPGKRYYGGCEYIDQIEQTAISRAKKLFNAEHVNVQPLSGAPMNLAVYSAFCQPGDTILGMDLSHGGHLTHGHPVTLSAKIYRFVRYTCDPKTGKLDYKAIEALAKAEKPKIVLAGFSAYSRNLNYKKFNAIAKKVGAISMMDMAHIAGLVAGKALENPVPIMDVVTTTTHKTLRGPRGGMIMCKQKYARQIDKAVFPGLQGGPHQNQIAALAVALHEAQKASFKKYAAQVLKNARVLCQELQAGGLKIVFGGTDNHLILADVTPLGLSGKEAEQALDEVGITVNKNIIPNDIRKPLDPSGIRLGTPALTTRGMKEPAMKKIGQMIIALLKNPHKISQKTAARKLVKELTQKFPLFYGV
ncbi:MAG: serine hydroxymethyltransferase [Candidatus Kerfeldbacteria bacterium RIFOXYA2_FULL_38_24]|uniref:Serine hydroxymethyltransferase n=1 Tax=Candidatus Kerfeldbacteria bacterium RIFOXYB2_FULL_38_14 TaxID=1798547 RepID=A0A1G2BHC4_9BACT|nr:MAG: serine hydroxymethyltransferase [Candidatus Kerfeldbacteria bacterium RIFOXYB2_FULL_38_14]OGY87880.1 MAG: serine hydroxymethyltransferase [Candidatus Kerfeldbacteria bacterium RIFOXYA2_FULL_38_24]OGY90025.1 MAG: serine hydroxymethyltransferase [Candidatus Kerfeldbacteria bacterium RIFOXYC2_FULL_38_9]